MFEVEELRVKVYVSIFMFYSFWMGIGNKIVRREVVWWGVRVGLGAF